MSDEENSRDSVKNDNEQSDDHETVISGSDNQSPPDNEEDERTAENMEKINQEFVLAAEKGRTSDVISLWTDNKAINIDTAVEDNYSAIHYASAAGNLELVNFLIFNSCNVHLKDKYGSTPIWFASQYGHMEVARSLLQAGADPDIPADYGDTAITVAHLFDHTTWLPSPTEKRQ